MLIFKMITRQAVLALAFFALLLAANLATAQGDCKAKLQKADEERANTNFDEAIALLTECLAANAFDQSDQPRAYRLLALSYIGKDYIDSAKVAINKLIDLTPAYKPDTEQDPPEYRQLFTQVTREREAAQTGGQKPLPDLKQKKGGGAKWLLIGGAVVAGGVAAAVLGGGGGGTNPPPNGESTLPTPPPLP